MDEQHSTRPYSQARDALRHWVWEQPLSGKQKLVLLAVVEFGQILSDQTIDLRGKAVRDIHGLCSLPPHKVWSLLKAIEQDALLSLHGDFGRGCVVRFQSPTVPFYEYLDLPDTAPGKVYAIKGTSNFIKIGRTHDINARIRVLSTASAEKPTLLATRYVGNAPAYETALHERFKKYRRNGEWFQLPRAELRVLLLALDSAL